MIFAGSPDRGIDAAKHEVCKEGTSGCPLWETASESREFREKLSDFRRAVQRVAPNRIDLGRSDGREEVLNIDGNYVRSSEVQRGILLDSLASDSPKEMLRHREPSQKARLDAGLKQFEKARRVIDEPFLFGLDTAREGSNFLVLDKRLVVSASM